MTSRSHGSAHDRFDRVLGPGRRPNPRPDTPARPDPRTRASIYRALTARVGAYLHMPELSDALRYLPLARSGYTGELLIVGGAASVQQALSRLDDAVDFEPEAIVDLDAPGEHCCVLMTYEDGGYASPPVTLAENDWTLGIADLAP